MPPGKRKENDTNQLCMTTIFCFQGAEVLIKFSFQLLYVLILKTNTETFQLALTKLHNEKYPILFTIQTLQIMCIHFI